MKEDLYSIGEFAKLLGVTIQTLRNWDENGTLHPHSVSEGGHRKYSVDQLNELRKKKKISSNLPVNPVGVVKYKNDFNRVDFTALNSTELKIFMAICSELKDQGEEEIYIDFSTLQELTNIGNVTQKEFHSMLQNIFTHLASLVNVYGKIEYNEDGKEIRWEGISKKLFNKFVIEYEDQEVLVSIHPDMVDMLNNWQGGKYTQFALEKFNSIKGFAACHLFHFLIQYINYPKMYISMATAKKLLGCERTRDDNFINQTIKGAMTQFENLGIILPGWNVKVIEQKKPIANTLVLTYTMGDEIRNLNQKHAKTFKKLSTEMKAKVSILREIGKNDAFIDCYIETEDMEKAEKLYQERLNTPTITEENNTDKTIVCDQNGSVIMDIFDERLKDLFGEF